MKLAIISDSHDQVLNLRAAVEAANQAGARMLIHCGDLISPFMLKELARFAGAVHLIYGNNVGDQHIISSSCGVRFPTITHHGVLGFVEADGRKIVFTHYPEMARGLANQGNFDVVCCGHNHVFSIEKVNNTLLLNPGDLLGAESQPAIILLDCVRLEAERQDVGKPLYG